MNHSLRSFSVIALGLLVLGILAAAVPAARAQEKSPIPTAAELARKVQQRYEKVADLSGSFEQESTVLGSRKKRKASGTVKFKKPGMMRWDYAEPIVQAFIADGKRFYYYNQQEKFVAVRTLTAAFDSPTPNDFLNGLGQLEKAFIVEPARDGIVDKDGRYRVTLNPKETAPGAYTLTLILEKDGQSLYGVTYEDAMGSVTVVRFVNLKENTGIDEKAFAFTPPKGVEVREEF